MELVGGSCEEEEEEVGGLGGASLEEGCWSVVGREEEEWEGRGPLGKVVGQWLGNQPRWMDTLQLSGGEVRIYVLFSSLSCSCRRANDRVSEPKYPVLCREGSGTPVVLGKIKRIKSLQPKPLEEEVARSLGVCVCVCVWGGGGGGA